MKILVITTSLRHGNSHSMAYAAIEAMSKNGADVEVIELGDKKISPCKGCNSCKKGEDYYCVQQDDELNNIVGKLVSCDSLILSSPIYFDSLPGQFKIFLDRLYCLLAQACVKKDHKKMGIILTAASSNEDQYNKVASFIASWFEKLIGITEYKATIASGCGAPNVCQKDESLLEEARKLGYWVTALTQ